MQSRPIQKFDFLSALYFLIIVLAFIVCFYTVFIDFQEFSNRGLGLNTYFSQRSWLSDKQAMLYCGIWISLFGFLLVLLSLNLYHRKRKTAIIVSLTIITLFVVSLFIEPLFYNALP